MLIVLAAVVFQLLKSSRKERLKYIKSFKRGKFALIYIALIPLYFLAYRHNGLTIDGSIWQAINGAAEAVVLKYHYMDVSSLANAHLFYKITVEIAFALITLNAIMFSISLVGQAALNQFSFFITKNFRKRIIVVVGTNSNSIDILRSIKKQQGKAVFIGKLTPDIKDEAYLCHADCLILNNDEDFGKKILALFKNFNKKKVHIIINNEDETLNLRYTKQLCKVIEEKQLIDLPMTSAYGLQAYVFASKVNESVFIHYEKVSYGLIKFINRHEQIAMDFIEKYPLTEFMTGKQLDYKTATIHENVDLNVIMIGFGKLNETLFLASVSNNQFLTKKNGKLQPKAVNYHLYDRNYPNGKIAEENSCVYSRNLNHGYMRYDQFLKQNASKQEDYLEFIEEPAKIHFHSCDFSHPAFYSSLHQTLDNKNAYSYVVVSFGTDIENIELAEKLQQKFHEWNIPSFVKIFVKIRDKKLLEEIKTDFCGDYIQLFGSNRDIVYNAQNILNEKIREMAKLRHLFYTAENLKKKGKNLVEEDVERLARKKWYEQFEPCQRESNTYVCLSLRMKLQLMGYDYAKEGKDCSAEFEAKYEINDKRTPSEFEINGKRMWNYSNSEQNRDSLRWTYAVQEHQRWCANMICNGIIPCNKKESTQETKELLKKRLHGNITTMSGLVDYRELVAKVKGDSTEKIDVIRYDYQIMDDVVWLLHKFGYSIIKKA